jgi:predicted Fe-S protein YdhL (DUF1289 family)
MESPCIRVCVIDPASQLCRGCKRSLREIAAWGSMTPDMRRAIMANLPSRIIDNGAAGA